MTPAEAASRLVEIDRDHHADLVIARRGMQSLRRDREDSRSGSSTLVLHHGDSVSS